MNCNSKKDALKKMKYQDGGEVESFDEMSDADFLENFNKEGLERVEKYKFNKPSKFSKDYGDSEDSRFHDTSMSEEGRKLAAYFGADIPEEDESEINPRTMKTLPEGIDDELARKMLVLKMLKDRNKK
jgi:hypothetical protein